MDHFNFNGKLFKAGTPVIGPDNRGLRYGDGLFETIRFKNGRLLMEDEHFARLWKGMQLLHFDVSRHFTPASLQEETCALVQKNGHGPDARVRVTVIRGDGGLYDPANHIPHYIIQSWKLPAESGAWNSNGLVAGIYEDAVKGLDVFSNIKHNNYLPYFMGAIQAKKQKWNDAILLNSSHRICDSTIANIFLVKNGVICTPALSEGCVAGIFRKHLLLQLPELGLEVTEKQVSREDLLKADEVFFTNSIYNIRWVGRIGEKEYGNAFTKKIYQLLMPTIS